MARDIFSKKKLEVKCLIYCIIRKCYEIFRLDRVMKQKCKIILSRICKRFLFFSVYCLDTIIDILGGRILLMYFSYLNSEFIKSTNQKPSKYATRYSMTCKNFIPPFPFKINIWNTYHLMFREYKPSKDCKLCCCQERKLYLRPLDIINQLPKISKNE